MTDDDLRALIEQHHQLVELTKHPGWEVLVDYALNGPAGSMSKQHRLVNGGAKDWDDYQRQTGWLAGAHHVLDAHQTVGKMVTDARVAKAEAEAAAEADQ